MRSDLSGGRFERLRRALVMVLALGVLVALVPALSPVAGAQPLGQGAEPLVQGDCPEGSILSSDGVTCELDVGQNDTGTNDPCPAGQRLDAAGLFCEAVPEDPTPTCGPGQELDAVGLTCVDVTNGFAGCPPGQKANEIGTACVPIEEPGASTNACQPGYSLGADGVTCVADGPKCGNDEVLGDDGTCVKTFQCQPGFVLGADLLTCMSDGCPEGELLSVDGKRCLAPDTKCPDGSPRPAGGNCLVVETVEGSDGTQVIVRCDEADAFCQAKVKECAEARAAGTDTGDESCENPLATCDDDDSECLAANQRLVQCAVRDAQGADGDPQRVEACEDLCPRLHRLDESGECIEYLDPTHPCVSFGQLPAGVTTNRQLEGYSFLAGTGQCVTRAEFLRRLGNFEAAAGAEADALKALRETTSQYLSVEDQLVELEVALVEAEQDVKDFTAAAAAADAERAQNEKDLHETRKQLGRELAVLEAEVVDVYVTGGPDAAVQYAQLGAADLTQVGIIQSYSEALLDDQIDNIDRIRTLEDRTITLGVELERAAAEVREQLDAAVVASDDLASLLAETERLRGEQLERRNQEAEMVAQLREEKGRHAQELGVFDQASREIADIIAESEFLVTEFEFDGEDTDGLFAKPVIPALIVSGFGPRLHPILGYVRNHNGLDFDANFGDPIYASAPGVVQIASSFGGYGQTVVLDHGNGLLTLYAHMSTIAVEGGDLVERGDVIGLIGSTGLSTGPHLHFEVWVDGRTAVDPVPYLNL